MRDVLRFVLGIGVLLLLLSALVTGGEPDAALPRTLPAAPERCAMTVPPETRVQAEAEAASDREITRPLRESITAVRTDIPAPQADTDANGRVLSEVRYAESVYTLFDPERAAG